MNGKVIPEDPFLWVWSPASVELGNSNLEIFIECAQSGTVLFRLEIITVNIYTSLAECEYLS